MRLSVALIFTSLLVATGASAAPFPSHSLATRGDNGLSARSAFGYFNIIARVIDIKRIKNELLPALKLERPKLSGKILRLEKALNEPLAAHMSADLKASKEKELKEAKERLKKVEELIHEYEQDIANSFSSLEGGDSNFVEAVFWMTVKQPGCPNTKKRQMWRKIRLSVLEHPASFVLADFRYPHIGVCALGTRWDFRIDEFVWIFFGGWVDGEASSVADFYSFPSTTTGAGGSSTLSALAYNPQHPSYHNLQTQYPVISELV
ncbi:hypothetical protein C8J56DRAFT_1129614 [Mycena floridula]|nr:hypothetical protein C8J56DRAFT_1129614 [Mycena floridula]